MNLLRTTLNQSYINFKFKDTDFDTCQKFKTFRVDNIENSDIFEGKILLFTKKRILVKILKKKYK